MRKNNQKKNYDVTHNIWYVSRTPDGNMWVETKSLEEFEKQNDFSKVPLKKYKYDSETRKYDAVITELA